MLRQIPGFQFQNIPNLHNILQAQNMSNIHSTRQLQNIHYTQHIPSNVHDVHHTQHIPSTLNIPTSQDTPSTTNVPITKAVTTNPTFTDVVATPVVTQPTNQLHNLSLLDTPTNQEGSSGNQQDLNTDSSQQAKLAKTNQPADSDQMDDLEYPEDLHFDTSCNSNFQLTKDQLLSSNQTEVDIN